MFALYELLDLLPPVFEPIFAPRLNKLCSFLLEHDRMKEKEAAEKYLGDIRRLKYFNNLKNELKKALIRYVTVYPSLTEHEHRVVFEECYRNFAAYKLLLTSGKRVAAIEIAKELLPKLRELELYSLAHIVIHDLFFHHSSINNSTPGLGKKYGRLAEIYFEYVKAESMVRVYHNRVGYICNSRDSYTSNIIAEFEEAATNTLPLVRLGCNNINRLIYTIVVARYVVVYDYENIIKYCDEALESFPKDHPNIRSLRFAFIHKKIPAYVASGRLNEAKEIAKEVCQLMPVGNFNWHIALIKRVIVCFHAGDYQEAYELFKAYKQQKPSSKNIVKTKTDSSKAVIEFWNILQGYLYFLIQRGKIEPYSDERFYLGKFLNDMPIYSRDKAGNNINILLIQILIHMSKEQFGPIIDRIESLNQYARTYTRNAETKRANTFIKMVIKMEAANFHRSRTELKAKKLVKRLNTLPLKIGQNLAIEIIPYQILWDEILIMLEDKFRTKSKRKTSKI